MVCPNCGHEIKPGQNFCDNCGLPLKKDINVSKKTEQPVRDDAVRSLSDLENELDAQDKAAQAKKEKMAAEQSEEEARKAADAKRIAVEKAYAEKMAAKRAQEEAHAQPSEDVDDKTRVFDFRDQVKQAAPTQPKQKPQVDPRMEMAPAQRAEFERQAHLNSQPKAPDNLNLDQPVHLDPKTGLPVYPDDKPVHHQEKTDEEQNDGLLANMINFLKNNIYVDVIAIVLVVITFFIKRNYAWILLAIFLVAWFLTSQIIHGKEIRLNKLMSHHDTKADSENNQSHQNNPQHNTNHQRESYQQQAYNQQPYQQQQSQPRQQPQAQKQAKPENRHHRNWRQNLIIIASIVAFIATITGPFVNGVSLSSTIAHAATVSSYFGAQTNLIMNLSSAVRFICFISPVIVLIAANFRSRGSIRLIKILSLLSSAIYIVAFALFRTNVINAALVTGQYAENNAQIGTSFYVLIVASVLSLLLAYTLKPRVKD
ncbi:zinc-ribbon domain-containing protein [Companilactobacillus sp.]|jgi:hypothetical protein|uniref:zinc-ribbon domain-containing protein n=1 Tax=Companilactobacillus sp. TaxID=2767905 RepID=UPI0025C36A14|nr:zinc-ribbon domain-containing protein [Companilactobacillus sp.]MCH4009020.1 zinc-ribbon domain-containing protein [Companilactobacillus sp.]MCH4050801.1 zinc-ribbon domain-containing protein [Companilactobacillus sp.]MCH4076962.1 zinc-ribbon domain-containing protein [Companilactobacillus sp.]MCH4125538.1 zinc-ribbon domain-containing protein [Companilactobacillus sp.]MCI1311247.1 zinc-ribbon domain-containing protein [Companilactobacillus sp.]